jgi:hypothetical protein
MLREISGVRQDDPAVRRRWFQDDYFDLFLWTDGAGTLLYFQLADDRTRRERVLAWDLASGYTHGEVEGGDESVFRRMTPLLAAHAGRFPKLRVMSEFDARADALDEPLRPEIRSRLVEYVPLRTGARQRP